MEGGAGGRSKKRCVEFWKNDLIYHNNIIIIIIIMIMLFTLGSIYSTNRSVGQSKCLKQII